MNQAGLQNGTGGKRQITMNKFFILFALLIFGAAGVSAQQTFVIRDASKTYDVKITIGSCEDEVCNDKATVYLSKKNRSDVFQTIQMSEMYIQFGAERKKLVGGSIEIPNDDIFGIGFTDYNFDGIDDLAVSNGYYAPYGGISSDVFLYDRKTGKFVRNEALSRIETKNMTVKLDKKQKTIEAFTKSGCCWNETVRYKYIGSRLVKIYAFTEDSSLGDGKVRVTTERFVGRRWKSTTKVFKTKDYFEDFGTGQ